MKIEEKELGARPHRMVELYALMAEIYDEVIGKVYHQNLRTDVIRYEMV